MTDACLASLKTTTVPYVLILVDNGTGYAFDNAPDSLQAVIRNPENRGWSVANNQGFKQARRLGCDILITLNCDTEVEPEWLEELLTAFSDPDVGIAGARLHYPHGCIQHSGIGIQRSTTGVNAYNRQDEHATEDVDGVTGACMAVRSDVFDDLGGYDTDFYNGNDDVSFCIAATTRGYRIRYVSTCRVMHHESAAGGGERWVKCYENVALLNEKWKLQ